MRILVVIPLMLGAVCAVPAASTALHRASADPRGVLRRVEQAESAYRAAHGRYTASLRALGMERAADVEVRIVAEAAGYSAVAIADDEECAVYHGRARPPRHWVRAPGRIACRPS